MKLSKLFKLTYVLVICDFLLIFGLTVSALYGIILVGYIVKLSLRWDIVTAIFPRPFVAGLIASMAYAVKRHLIRTLPNGVRLVRPSPNVVIPKSVSTTLTDKPKKLYQQILAQLQTCPKESRKPLEIEETAAKIKEREYNVFKLASKGKSVYEIGLRLFMDPVQVEKIIASLNKKGRMTSGFQETRT